MPFGLSIPSQSVIFGADLGLYSPPERWSKDNNMQMYHNKRSNVCVYLKKYGHNIHNMQTVFHMYV